MSRARVSVPSLEPYVRPRGRCFIVFFSRETYAVDDNELVIPWIPCRWDFRLHARPPQGRSRRDRSLSSLIVSYDIDTSSPCCQDRYDRDGFSLLDRTRILSLSLFLRSDRMINTNAVRDDFRRASINEGQMCALYSRLYKVQQKYKDSHFDITCGKKLSLLV